MYYNNEQATAVLELIEQGLKDDAPAPLRLRKIWLQVTAMRARNLAYIIRSMVGSEVIAGPFKGMKLTADAIKGYNACIMLGTYEHELHPIFEKIIAGNYTHILNIGCSVGYYAVGLAMRMPHLTIDAFDIQEEARRQCQEMAILNGVQDRVRIGSEFRSDDFTAYANQRTLAIVDIEGAELALLDPGPYPALKKIDLVIELHDLMKSDLSEIMAARFAPTHDIQLISNRNTLPDVDALIPKGGHLDPFDHLLLGWEGRGGPTPWGVFTVKDK